MPGRVFLRFDDVGHDKDDRLDEMLEACGNENMHCLLAVVPGDLGALRATALRSLTACTVFQHGVSHENRAAQGSRRDEFPDYLGVARVIADIEGGRRRLEDALGREIAGYVPPWNYTSDSA